MFTRNIKNLIQLGKSGVRWEAPTKDSDIVTGAELSTLRDLWNKTDRKAFDEALKKITINNEKKKIDLFSMIDSQIYTVTQEGDNKELSKLLDFKKSVEEVYTKLKWEYEYEKTKTTTTAMNSRAWLRESVESSDNNDRQAEALIISLRKLWDKNPWAKALLERLITKNNGDAYIKLSTLNIGGMLEWMAWWMRMKNGITPIGYRSNGLDIGETVSLRKLADSFSTDKEKVEAVAKTIRSFYDAGQTTEDYLMALNKNQDEEYDKTKFVAYLSEYREGATYDVKFDKEGKGKLETKDRSYMTLYIPGELQWYLWGMTPEILAQRVTELIKIGWGSVTGAKAEDLQKEMYAKPELRAAYIKGLNYVALSNDRAGFFKTGKIEAGINGTKVDGIVESLLKDEQQNAIKDWVAKSVDEYSQKLKTDTSLNTTQRENITKKMNDFATKLSDPEKLKTFSLEWATFITNNRLGGGVATTKKLDSTLADSVSLGGMLSKEFGGSLGWAIALVFTKEIFASEKAEFGAHYGVSYTDKLMPLIGFHGRYEDFVASVTATPAGQNIYMGIRAGTNRWEVENIQRKIGESQAAIRELAVANDSARIDLSKIISNPAIAERMTTDLRVILEKNQFSAATTPDGKYMVMYSSILEVMNMEVLRLYREKNDMGWTVDQLGLNFGRLWGILYVLPGFRIEKNDLQIAFTKSTRSEVVGKKIENINVDTLFDKPKFKEWTKEYSIPLKANSPINNTNSDLPNWATIVIDENSGAPTAIRWLKDYWVKVTQVDGKYTIEYDKAKPVTVVQWAKKVEAKLWENLARVDTIEQELSNPTFRKALSNLLINPDRKGNANILAHILQYLGTQNCTLLDAKMAFLKTITEPKLLPVFKWVHDQILAMNVDNPDQAKQLQSALFDLRWGMMMDMTQSRNVESKNGTVSVKEEFVDTQKRFDSMLNKMWWQLQDMGLTKEDYNNLLQQWWDGKSLSMTGIKSGVLGAIASLKTRSSYMARMPAGTVRFAQSGTSEFMKDITTESNPVRKSKMLQTIIPADSLTENAYRKSIAKTMGVAETEALMKVTSTNFVELMTQGNTKINGRTVNMSDQKFMLCAYGDCTNPGIALQVGKITSDAIPWKASVDISAIAERTIMKDVESISVAYGFRTTWFSAAVWYENPKSTGPTSGTNPETPPDPPKEPPPELPTGWTAPISTTVAPIAPAPAPIPNSPPSPSSF